MKINHADVRQNGVIAMNVKLVTIGMCAAIAVSAIPSQAYAKTRLTVNCFWPSKHFMCTSLLPTWLSEVEKVTEGRVVGNIPPKSVAPPPAQLASVEKRVVDAAIQFSGLIGNRVKGPLVAMQPFIGNDNTAAMSQALWETNRKYFPDEFETVQLLSQWTITPGQLFSSTDKPINSVEELASRKIWALPGPLAAMSKKLGAGVVSGPAVKSNEIISRGVVDGHIGLSGDGLKAFQLLPYTKSMTKFSKSLYNTSFNFVINKDTWAEISPADQAAIMEVSGVKFGVNAAKKWQSVNDSVFETFPSKGIQIVDADPAFEQALVDTAKPMTAAWVKAATESGIDAEAAMAFFKQRIAELSK